MRSGPKAASELDTILTAQLAVGWAGEGGEEPRLGWWRCDLTSEYGGLDLFDRLVPATARWAALQSAREAGRRVDAARRGREHDADRWISLFYLGPELDERLDERLLDHKRSGRKPAEALPGLREVTEGAWDRASFLAWVEGHGRASVEVAPIGRRLVGEPSGAPERRVAALVAALAPLGPEYPLPHYRVSARPT